MSKWEAPLLGRRVEILHYIPRISEKGKHWWNLDKYINEQRVVHTGEVVDRSPVSAQYLIACEDGKLRWEWSSSLRIINDA